MAYQARRKKLYEEEFELLDENDVVVHKLHVELDPDAMAKKLSVKHLALTNALQNIHGIEVDKTPVDAVEAVDSAVKDILEAVFGPDDAKTIEDFYGGKVIMMTREVLPFVTDVVIPEVRKMAKQNRKTVAAGYGRPKFPGFGRK